MQILTILLLIYICLLVYMQTLLVLGIFIGVWAGKLKVNKPIKIHIDGRSVRDAMLKSLNDNIP